MAKRSSHRQVGLSEAGLEQIRIKIEPTECVAIRLIETFGKEDNQMKKSMTRILIISLAVVWMASPVLSQTTKTSAPTGEPIKIGGSLPLTGLASEQAKLIKAGYEYWAEDINKRGGLLGRPVRLIMYDDESTAEKAVTYYE